MEAYTQRGLLTVNNPGTEIIADLALSVTSAAMWNIDLTDQTVTWGPQLPGLLGLQAAPASDVRRWLLSLITPLTVAAQDSPVWEDFDLEQCHQTPEGKARWIRFLARSYGNGKTRGLLGIATDVTERHGHEQALEDLADRYRLLVDLSPDGICVHERGRLVYVNPAALGFVGVSSADELLDHPITDFVDPDSIPGMLRRIKSLDKPGATSDPAEATLLRRDGGTLLVESVSVRTTWEGRPAFQVIMRDITAQKAAEEALQYRAALVTHVSDAIIATTADGTVTSWNPAAENVYGRTEQQAKGRKVSALVGARLDPVEIMRAGGVADSIHHRASGAPLAIRVSAAEMHDGYVLVCSDETPRRQAERRFATVVASLDEGVVVVAADGLVESANPAAGRILGFPVRAMLGKAPTLFPLYDESGASIPPAEYPSTVTRLSGRPHEPRVVQVRRPDGDIVWLSLSCRPLDPDAKPPSTVVSSFTDITERRAIGARLEHDATHDPLTGLANRTLVLRRLDDALDDPRRTSMACVLFIDLDKFKVINDSLGHAVGDKVLHIVGDRLRHRIRQTDLVGRLGGDEFAVVTFGAKSNSDIEEIIFHLRQALTQPISVDGRRLRVDASIGIVTAPPGDRRCAEDLIRDADVAMYEAKKRGRGRHEFFDVELRERIQRELRLEQDLQEAVRDGQLWVAYQPVVDLRTRRMVAVEGLMRWQHPAHGLIPPGEFIPLAEESELINRIGDFMLRTTAQEIAVQRRLHGLDTQLTVNLSARQLDERSLERAVDDVLRMNGLRPETLCLEITESALVREPDAAAKVLTGLRKLGVRLAIDDYGTGYSSLKQLWQLPLDTLKIDRSFVAELGKPGQQDAETIIKSTVQMAHGLDLTVIAEGAEHERQAEILAELGCDQAQGYLFGKPAPARELFPQFSTREC